jgi:hypothetical protein
MVAAGPKTTRCLTPTMDAPATITLDYLRWKPGSGHPVQVGLGTFRLAALGLNPLAVMRDSRGKIEEHSAILTAPVAAVDDAQTLG